MRALIVATLTAAAALAGCGGGDRVMRVVNGRVVEGSYVEPEAYAAFLRGAIADASGDAKGALASYEEAARFDGEDPEIWTRIGDLRCRDEVSGRDGGADAALDRALRLDATYGPAWDARARCSLARGDAAHAADAAAHAVEADPLAVEPEVLAAHAERIAGRDAGARGEEVRRRLLALTMLHADRGEAWHALAAWAASHGDAPLRAFALERLVPLAPSRRGEVAASALALAGAGEVAAARSLAAALIDAGWAGERRGSRFALIARLAIDDAIVRRDADRARLRATHAHVGLDVVAARALLLGDSAIARAIAEPLVDADPGAAGGRLVLAAADARDASARARALGALARGSAPLPIEAILAFARVLARETTRDAARAFAAQVARGPLLPHDALTTSLAVDLAARGVLDAAELPADGVIELAARRGDALPGSALGAGGTTRGGEAQLAPDDAALDPPVPSASAPDARHALLALSLSEPRSTRTGALARLLAPSLARDPIVAVAFARLALAGAAPLRADALARFDPSEPLVAAAAYDLAVREGNASTIPTARARLAAVARTPAERARVE